VECKTNAYTALLHIDLGTTKEIDRQYDGTQWLVKAGVSLAKGRGVRSLIHELISNHVHVLSIVIPRNIGHGEAET
jgi:hypothetical protein